jgi:TPR repeat protein
VRYLKGDGVEKDEATGWKWIQASATNGYSLAVTKLEDMPKPKKK